VEISKSTAVLYDGWMQSDHTVFPLLVITALYVNNTDYRDHKDIYDINS
jgi:hypothetical protein